MGRGVDERTTFKGDVEGGVCELSQEGVGGEFDLLLAPQFF